MSLKIIRDPLYNYIAIDLDRDRWLLELLDCPEVQRLRRIHQLGVSDTTYPGASHTRFSHTLGVLHLMQQVHQHIERVHEDKVAGIDRERLLAAAVLHDVGHGPFSHLFEPCLGIDHESWSVKIVRNEDGAVNRVLREVDPTLPETVAQLIEKDNYHQPQWQKFLLSSQLDVDRMDYLRRDSLFTGGGYGHFDWYRLINMLELHDGRDGQCDIVWPEKAKFAIEEYIFARYYMYQNVYLHKTTRGFEKIVEAMWCRAKQLSSNGDNVGLALTIRDYWGANSPRVEQYLAIEEFTVLEQIQRWRDHKDKALSDLAARFLDRRRFAMIEPPTPADDLEQDYDAWEEKLKDVVKKAGYDPNIYVLRDTLKAKYNQPYFPEKESNEQSAKNAIRIRIDGEASPIEVSHPRVLRRLKEITTETRDRFRYYVPPEAREAATKLRDDFSSSASPD